MSWNDDDYTDEIDELDEDEDEDEDEEEEDDDEEEEDEEQEVEQEDEEEQLQRLEQVFRGERARIRQCDDLQELRALRATYVAEGASGQLHPAARLRARDLVELIDDRLTDLKARRLLARRGR